MKKLIKDSVMAAMTYAEYMLLFKQLVQNGQTTGELTKEKIDFTKLNYSRSKRLDKTLFLTEIQAKRLKDSSQPQTWLVLSEPWCGDAAQTLPLLNKIAEAVPAIQLKIVLRDEHPQLMDAFLTAGARSIPKLLILDEEFEVTRSWGPRSQAATQLVSDYKAAHGALDAAFKETLQMWYNKDRGQAIIKELMAMVEQENPKEAIID
ncbi:thioredoxin family protein [Altibacter sp.]|uniref:thioredoxin family protein n=1 Tax=Altibacter sp. TaxID=2024823 RepID=UPI0025864ED8|nr:thioredoxin family protein [Altibacter sp.]MCW9037280.1 thioredoxin family protein [Altibacter sp.]